MSECSVQGANLLLLEDDQTLATLTKKSLEKRGYTVVHVSNLTQAASAIAGATFSDAVLDLKLEEETSLSIIPDLRAYNRDMNILVLTAYASIATAVEAVKRGANNYLPKPANVSEIIKALQGGEPAPQQHETEEVETMSPKRLEWEHIQRVLLKNDGNISATARELNMHRRTLQRKLQKKPVKG